MTPAETLANLPQATLEKWRLVLSVAFEHSSRNQTELPISSYHLKHHLSEELEVIAEAINEALELKQLNHYKGYEETKTPLGL